MNEGSTNRYYPTFLFNFNPKFRNFCTNSKYGPSLQSELSTKKKKVKNPI